MDIEKLVTEILAAKQRESNLTDAIYVLYAEIEDMQKKAAIERESIFDLVVQLSEATKDMSDSDKQAVWAQVRH